MAILSLMLVIWRLDNLQQQPFVTPEITEASLLFDQLWVQQLITQQPHGLLRLAWPDAALLQAESANAENIAIKKALLKSLYQRPVGQTLRQEVRLWNQTRALVAIRDNQPGQWQYEALDAPRIHHALQLPDSFGYIHQGQFKAGFQDWQVIPSLHHAVTFTRQYNFDTATRLRVQMIGKPTHWPGKKPPVRYAPPASLQRACPTHQGAAWQGVIDLPAGATSLSISLQPAFPCIANSGELQIHYSETTGQWSWRPKKTSPPVSKAFTLASQDGELLWADKKITAFARDYGLLPLLGYDHHDWQGALHLLRLQNNTPGQIRFTLESRLQKASYTALQQEVGRLFPASDRYSPVRRGAVVVLDADNGAILAVANYPALPAAVTAWDRRAFTRVYPVQSPWQVQAWQTMDRHNAPGSTFKPVVALTALQDNSEPVRRLLQGRLGLPLSTAAYDPYKDQAGPCQKGFIRNFGCGALRNMLAKPLRLGGKKSQRTDLAAAVRDSVNVWFARLAILLDGEAASKHDDAMQRWQKGQAKPQPPKFKLAAMAKRLGMLEVADLAAGVAGFKHYPGDPLQAIAGQMDLVTLDRNLTWTTAQTGIGQGMIMPTLAMARVAATIASGTISPPHLIAKWGDQQISATGLAFNLDMKVLRQGMKAVTEISTARAAFAKHPDQRRTYGKTGTANVGKQRQYWTGWFIGFRAPSGAEKRLAFACSVTHIHGAKKNFGGKVCGPVIAALLRSWQAGKE